MWPKVACLGIDSYSYCDLTKDNISIMLSLDMLPILAVVWVLNIRINQLQMTTAKFSTSILASSSFKLLVWQENVHETSSALRFLDGKICAIQEPSIIIVIIIIIIIIIMLLPVTVSVCVS